MSWSPFILSCSVQFMSPWTKWGSEDSLLAVLQTFNISTRYRKYCRNDHSRGVTSMLINHIPSNVLEVIRATVLCISAPSMRSTLIKPFWIHTESYTLPQHSFSAYWKNIVSEDKITSNSIEAVFKDPYYRPSPTPPTPLMALRIS